MGNILVPLKKFLANKNTVTILGILVGLVVLYFGYTWRVNQAVSPIDVPYATQTLISGTKITEDVIGYRTVPKDTISKMENILLDINSIRNYLVSYDSKIPMNGFFFSDNLISEEDMPDSVFSNIKDGETIFSLPVNAESTYSNSIFPGDQIDLYLNATSEDGKLIFGRFLSNMQVLAVKDSSGKNVFADKDNLGTPAALLFAVPEDLFLLLSKAKLLGGIEIVPVPRNDSYTVNAAATELQSEDLESFVREKTYIIPNECTDLTVC